MGYLSHSFDIEHITARVADRFPKEELGVWPDRPMEVFRVVWLYEGHVVAELTKADVKLRVGPPYKVLAATK